MPATAAAGARPAARPEAGAVPARPDARAAGRQGLHGRAQQDADIVWIADGLENGGSRGLRRGSGGSSAMPARRRCSPRRDTPVAAVGSDNTPDSLAVHLVRADAQAAGARHCPGLRPQGPGARRCARSTSAPAPRRTPRSTLPVELRNQIARVDVVGDASAGAVTLLDARWKRRRVEIVSGRYGRRGAAAAEPELLPHQGPGALRRRAGSPGRHRPTRSRPASTKRPRS